MELNYTPLLVIFIIAWLVPFVLSWLEISKVPAVIVTIVIGVIAGPSVLDLISDEPYLDFLSQTGFIFLIFLAGLEIDIKKISASLPRGRIKLADFYSNTLLVSLIIYFASLLLSFLFILVVSNFFDFDIAFFTLLLPTVALSITVPILKADGELNQKFGQIMLMEGAIATIMSIILISVYSGVLKNGFEVELLLFSIIFIVFVLFYVVGKRLVQYRTFQNLLYRLQHAASQIRIRGTVALILLFVVVSYLIDTELIMGAFFAGVLLSIFVNKERSSLLFKLDGMSYGFFIPIFFVMVGVNLELSALSQFQSSIPFVLIVTLGIFLTQISPTLILAKLFGIKKALAGGFLLSARLGLTIAAAQVGLALQVINSAENAGIVTAAIFSSLLSPLAYKLLHGDEKEDYSTYILGGSKSSFLLAYRMKLHGYTCLTYLTDKELIEKFKTRHLPFKQVDKIDEELVRTINLKASDLIITLTGSKSLNLFLSRYIKAELNHGKIITIISTTLNDEIKGDETMEIVDLDKVLADRIEDMIMRPDSFAAVSQSFEDYGIEEIRMTNSDLDRKLVKSIAFPQTGSLVILRRGNEIFIPHGDTHILLGDIITVIGNSDALIAFRKLFR